MIPRGIRNNNPGNIRLNPKITWIGQAEVQTDPSFVVFTSPVYGLRAIGKIMKKYEKDGISTIDGAINRWAPPSENNSTAYIQAVCTDCALAPQEPVSLSKILLPLIKAIVTHENGQQPYSDELINQAIALT